MNLNSIIAKILKINLSQFEELVDGRGMRPVKAAIRLGAEPEKAQIFAGLKLATTAEEITAVYSNDSVKSCMTGKDVGPFYATNNIGCIYSNNYRCLINLETMALCVKGHWRGYGYHRDIISNELGKHFLSEDFISNKEVIKEESHSAEILKVIRTPTYNLSCYGWEIKEIKFNFFGESKTVKQWDLHQNELKEITNSFVKFVKEESQFFLTNSSSKTLELVVPNVGRLPSVTLSLRYGELRVYHERVLARMQEAMGGGWVPKVYAKNMHERKVKEETLHFEGGWWEREKYWCTEKIVTSFSVRIRNEYRNVYKKYTRYYEISHVVKPKGVYIPYFDFNTVRKDVTDNILNHYLIKDNDELEDYYLNTLGDSYKERMNHPRRNLSHGRKSIA